MNNMRMVSYVISPAIYPSHTLSLQLEQTEEDDAADVTWGLSSFIP